MIIPRCWKWVDSVLLLVLLAGAIACGSEEPRTDPVRIVSDSSGVQIVSLDPEAGDVPHWVTSETPTVQIGRLSGDEAEEFFRITGAVTLSDGRIVVGSRGTSELRVFAPDGGFLKRFGRDGEGPGEFRDISFIAHLAGDTVLVHDRSLQRVSFFSANEGFVRSMPFPGPGAAPFQIVAGVMKPPALVSWSLMKDPPQTPGVHRTVETIGVFDLRSGGFLSTGKLSTVEEGLVMAGGRLRRAYPPMGRKGDIVSGGDVYYVLQSTDDRSIEVSDRSGHLTRILRLKPPESPPNPAAVQDWIDSFIRQTAGESEELAASLTAGFEEMPTPSQVPLFRSLEAGVDGNVCAERYPSTVDAPPAFWCFSPEGEFIRTISFNEAPRRGLHPFHDGQLEIGPDYVLGVYSDDLGVEYVRRYELRRLSGHSSEGRPDGH